MKLGNNRIKLIGISMSAFALLVAGNISVSAQETESMISDETIAVEVTESIESTVSYLEEITSEVEIIEENTHSNIDLEEYSSHEAISETQSNDETSNVTNSIVSEESAEVIADESIGIDEDYGDDAREIDLDWKGLGDSSFTELPFTDQTNDSHREESSELAKDNDTTMIHPEAEISEESVVELVDINTPIQAEGVNNKTTIEIEQAAQVMNETRTNADEAQAQASALEYEADAKAAYFHELRAHAEALHSIASTDEEYAEVERLRIEAANAEADYYNAQNQAYDARANADVLTAMALEAEARYVSLLAAQAEKIEPIPYEPGVVDVIELERQARDTLERAEEAIVVARETLAYAEAITAEAEAFYMYARDTLYYAQTDEEMAQANQLLAEAEALKISAYSEQAVAQVAMAEADALYHYAIQLQAQLEETIRNNIKHEYYFEDYLHERYDTQVPVNGYYERYNITHKETYNHKTIYLPSADLEFGQQVVAEEGYDGYQIYHIINQYDAYTNQYIGEQRVWWDSFNVRDRVILVGNAVHVATNELPYETHYHGSEDLALGETKVVSEGTNTIENIISYYDIDYYTGEILNKLSSESQYLHYDPRVIAVGNVLEKTVDYTPHQIIYIEDSNLNFGEQYVRQDGYDGEYHTTVEYDIDWQTGELLTGTIINKWWFDAQDTVIAVGNRNRESRVETIEFERQYRGGNNLHFGEKRFVSPGRNGYAYYDEIYSVNSETGELVYIGDENTWSYPPENEIVEIGTVETTIHQMPYNVIYIDDSTLDYRETIVVQEGKNGIIKQFNYYNVMPDGELVLEFSDYDEIPSIEKVIHIGTNLDGENISPYRTYYANDRTLTFGSQNIAVEGIDGNPSIGQERQDQIIYVGSATESKKVQVPFETIYRVNNMLELDERKVIQEGVEGESESLSIYFVNQETGELTLRSVLASPIIEPTPMIVEIGNREIITHEMPYQTFFMEDHSLPYGSVKVVQEGVVGVNQEMTDYILNTVTGELLDIQLGSKGGPLVNSIDEIIAINPITKDVIETPFNTIYVSNPNLAYGERSIIQAGQNGQYITYSKNKLDSMTGELYEVEFTYNEEFASVDQIIEVGTRLVERIEDAIEVDYIADSQVPYGEHLVVSHGENKVREVINKFEVDPVTGELTLINEETINIAAGKKQVVHVGNQKVEEYIIPYEITYIDNNDLLEGEKKVIQAGKDGMVKVSTISSVDSVTGELSILTVLEEVISNPIHQIIEIGTKVAEVPDDSEDQEEEENHVPDEEATKGNEDNKEDVDQPEDLNEEDEDSGDSDSSQIDDDKKVNHPDSNINEVPKDVLPEESETTDEKSEDLEESSHDKIELEDLIDGYNDISVDKTVVLPATGETTSVLWTSLASLLGISGIGVLLRGKKKE